jgi:hypothetical protein
MNRIARLPVIAVGIMLSWKLRQSACLRPQVIVDDETYHRKQTEVG